jgi:large subunit ribosomal protein L6
MSRIGRKPITIPSGVNVTLDNTQITVKGPKGSLSRELHKDMKVNVLENEISVERPSDNKLHRSLLVQHVVLLPTW